MAAPEERLCGKTLIFIDFPSVVTPWWRKNNCSSSRLPVWRDNVFSVVLPRLRPCYGGAIAYSVKCRGGEIIDFHRLSYQGHACVARDNCFS